MNDSRLLPLLRSTHYKKAIQHCNFTVVALCISQHNTFKTATRQSLEMVWLYRDHDNIWYDTSRFLDKLYSETKDKAALGLVNWLFWILLKCLTMLWTYLLFTYFSMCEWVCMSAQAGCLFLCLCVSSLIAWKVFVLHVCIYSCGDVHLHLLYALTCSSHLINKETSLKKNLSFFFQSTAHKSSILCYAQRHEASSSGLKSNILV